MTGGPSVLPADDLGRTATIVHADDPSLVHLGVGAGTYTILVSGEQTGGRGGQSPPH